MSDPKDEINEIVDVVENLADENYNPHPRKH